MGVVNVTPDSFSDGGEFYSTAAATDHALRLFQQGADILDIGGESTRPGAEPVSVDEELKRVLPVIEALAGQDGLLSVDTTKAEVAKAAMEAGAHIINDVSGLESDSAMADVAVAYQAGVIIMHMQGTPGTMQAEPVYEHVREDVARYLMNRIDDLERKGLPRSCMVIDPGIGFGKTLDHNLSLLAGLRDLEKTSAPVLLGLSRKSFIGKLTGQEVGDRLPGSLSAMVYGVTQGAHIMRVHDVKASVQAVKIADALLEKEGPLGMD